MEAQLPPPEGSLPFTAKDSARFFFRNLEATSIHLGKGWGLKLLTHAAWDQPPHPIKEQMIAGGIGLLTAAEILDMRRNGELKSLFETARIQGVKEAANDFIQKRRNLRMVANTLATGGLIATAEIGWSGYNTPFQIIEKTVLCGSIVPFLYTAVRRGYHNVLAIKHGLGSAVGAMGIITTAPQEAASYAMEKYQKGKKAITYRVNKILGRS